MKSISTLRMVILFMTLSVTMPAFPNGGKTTTPTTLTTNPSEAEAKAEAERLIKRLEEIKAMDKSDLSRAEKRALRKEVKEIKSTLKATGHGIYLSVGAIIIIILLLILLL